MAAFCELSTADASPPIHEWRRYTRAGNGRHPGPLSPADAAHLPTYKYTNGSWGGWGGEAGAWANIVFVWTPRFKIRANISSHLGVGRACFILFFYQALPAGPRH